MNKGDVVFGSYYHVIKMSVLVEWREQQYIVILITISVKTWSMHYNNRIEQMEMKNGGLLVQYALREGYDLWTGEEKQMTPGQQSMAYLPSCKQYPMTYIRLVLKMFPILAARDIGMSVILSVLHYIALMSDGNDQDSRLIFFSFMGSLAYFKTLSTIHTTSSPGNCSHPEFTSGYTYGTGWSMSWGPIRFTTVQQQILGRTRSLNTGLNVTLCVSHYPLPTGWELKPGLRFLS